jgi:hypothetical protein
MRGLVEQQIRASPRLQHLWNEWANRKLRGVVAFELERSRARFRKLVAVDARQPLGALAGRLRSRLRREAMIFYEAPAEVGRPDPEVVPLRGSEVLAMLGDEIALDARGRAQILDGLSQGRRAFGVLREGRAVQVCWLRRAEPEEVLPGRGDVPTWVIVECVTARRARGQGLYPKALRAIRAVIPEGDACFIYTNDWNVASQRGILKAGFKPVSIRERTKRRGAVTTRWLPAP